MTHDAFDDRILELISDSSDGCGEDLAFDTEVVAIQRLKIEEDGLDQGEWVTDIARADWAEVSRRCQDMLASKSKDLKLVFWLIEAHTKLHGFAGLSAGMSLLSSFLDNFWEGLYPSIEDGDLEPRVGLVEWFNKTVDSCIKDIAISESELGQYSFNHFISARALDEKQKRTDAEEQNSNALTLTDYQSAVRATDVAIMHAKLNYIDLISKQWLEFGERMDKLLGEDAPVFSKVGDTLDEIYLHIESMVGKPSSSPELSDADQARNTITDKGTIQSVVSRSFSPNAGSHLENRQHALKLLGEVQEYFALNEPHSPVTYMLAKTISWANMPLHQWLEQVIKQPEQLEQLKDILGESHQQNS